jgi:hypothetical protein
MASTSSDEMLAACCLTEYNSLPGNPRGKIMKIADMDTYFIPGKDGTSKGKVILLLTDLFGK